MTELLVVIRDAIAPTKKHEHTRTSAAYPSCFPHVPVVSATCRVVVMPMSTYRYAAPPHSVYKPLVLTLTTHTPTTAPRVTGLSPTQASNTSHVHTNLWLVHTHSFWQDKLVTRLVYTLFRFSAYRYRSRVRTSCSCVHTNLWLVRTTLVCVGRPGTRTIWSLTL